ncbi:hypothetical protein [Sphaerisporangium sp. TRM90804]|uniref:hypothetical protein n=1 Tax=Sphaerisporangium sp. TRM90804 TaxID=3031113 RepID=UPI00244AC9EB|nr:hypothetical protein [Sphaerisporangium sp. TRM90804]MDH2424798.1 hypothetical protein [Sphaerisporangium sp. TRM90804]
MAETPLTASTVDAWNATVPEGTPVRYWPGRREGDGRSGRTRSAARLLGGHTPVVWVTGHSSCIALTHVEPTTPEQTGDRDA